MLDIKEPVYQPAIRRDVLQTALTLDFEPAAVIGPEAAARALYDSICNSGYSSPEHIQLWSPEETQEMGYGGGWSICWEEGPFEWTITTSWHCHGPGFYAEPWNSFILCFVEN